MMSDDDMRRDREYLETFLCEYLRRTAPDFPLDGSSGQCPCGSDGGHSGYNTKNANIMPGSDGKLFYCHSKCGTVNIFKLVSIKYGFDLNRDFPKVCKIIRETCGLTAPDELSYEAKPPVVFSCDKVALGKVLDTFREHGDRSRIINFLINRRGMNIQKAKQYASFDSLLPVISHHEIKDYDISDNDIKACGWVNSVNRKPYKDKKTGEMVSVETQIERAIQSLNFRDKYLSFVAVYVDSDGVETGWKWHYWGVDDKQTKASGKTVKHTEKRANYGGTIQLFPDLNPQSSLIDNIVSELKEAVINKVFNRDEGRYDALILVESELCAIALRCMGLPGVAICSRANIKKADFIKRYILMYPTYKRLYIALDNKQVDGDNRIDEDGAEEIYQKGYDGEIWIVDLHDDYPDKEGKICKDPDDFFKRDKEVLLYQNLLNARLFTPTQVRTKPASDKKSDDVVLPKNPTVYNQSLKFSTLNDANPPDKNPSQNDKSHDEKLSSSTLDAKNDDTNPSQSGDLDDKKLSSGALDAGSDKDFDDRYPSDLTLPFFRREKNKSEYRCVYRAFSPNASVWDFYKILGNVDKRIIMGYAYNNVFIKDLIARMFLLSQGEGRNECNFRWANPKSVAYYQYDEVNHFWYVIKKLEMLNIQGAYKEYDKRYENTILTLAEANVSSMESDDSNEKNDKKRDNNVTAQAIGKSDLATDNSVRDLLLKLIYDNTDDAQYLFAKSTSINYNIFAKNGVVSFDRKTKSYHLLPHNRNYYNLTCPSPFNFIPDYQTSSLNYGYEEGEWDKIANRICDYFKMFLVPDENSPIKLYADRVSDEAGTHDSDEDDVIRYILTIFGYSLVRMRSRIFFLVIGSTGSGKSLLFNIALGNLHNKLNGEYSTFKAASYKDLRGESESTIAMIWDIDSKLVMFDDDFKTGNILPDEILKKLSTNYSYPKKVLYENITTSTSTVLPIILTNGLPKIVDMTIDTRLHAIPMFNNVRFSTEEYNDCVDFFSDYKVLQVLFNMSILEFERSYMNSPKSNKDVVYENALSHLDPFVQYKNEEIFRKSNDAMAFMFGLIDSGILLVSPLGNENLKQWYVLQSDLVDYYNYKFPNAKSLMTANKLSRELGDDSRGVKKPWKHGTIRCDDPNAKAKQPVVYFGIKLSKPLGELMLPNLKN